MVSRARIRSRLGGAFGVGMTRRLDSDWLSVYI